MSNPILKNCTLCEHCGFLEDSKPGVLREDMGLLEIIENQVIFPCHQTLKAYNSSHHNGRGENTGTKEMVEDTGVIEVCTGYIQSLIKSGIPPKHRAMTKLMMEVMEIDPRIMTIEETIARHKGH